MSRLINFFNEDIKFNLPGKIKVRCWIGDVISDSGMDYSDLNFIFCSDNFLLNINRSYLHHDYFTDIITFPSSIQRRIISGDIFISIERVKENAKLNRQPFIEELHRVMIHGILHLLGYKDKRKADVLIMRRMENKMLSLRSF